MVFGSTLLDLRGGGYQISREKSYVTLEWPLLVQGVSSSAMVGLIIIILIMNAINKGPCIREINMLKALYKGKC